MNNSSIRIKRGLKADLPSELPMGELAYCTDTQELYIGMGTGMNVAPQKVMESDLAMSGRFKIVKDVTERDELRLLEDGVICYVQEDNVYYKYKDGEWDVFSSGSGGSGGGAVIGTLTSSLDRTTVTVATGESVSVDLYFTTPNVGSGQLYVLSNGVEFLTQTVSMGSSKINLTLPKGTHNVEIYVVDRGGVYTNSILFTVNCGSLEISTTFDSSKDYNVGSIITFPYNVDTISSNPIITYFNINGSEYSTSSNKGYNTYVFPNLGVGVHKVEVYSVSGEFISNKISFNLIMLASDTLYVSSLFDKTQVEEGDQVAIDYRISMKDVKEFDVEYYVDGDLIRTGLGFNGTNTFLTSSLPLGNRLVTIKVFTKDRVHSAELKIPILVVESSYEMQQPVTTGLIAWFDAYDQSNNDSDREVWKDKTGNGYTGKLKSFNYVTNGWFDNGLKMNGSAYVQFDVKPLLDNAELGMTFDIEFETEDIGNEYARVLDYTSNLSSALGIHIDTAQCYMKSNSATLTSHFAENTKTRVTYVIDRIQKLALVYVNAVLCNASFLTDTGIGNDQILEDFSHDQDIYLNSQKGTSNFGECTVYSLRVYGRPLNSEEVLQNHIADIRDKEQQKAKRDFNYNNTIPTMYFYGDVSSMTKDNPVSLRVKYISTDDEKFGSSFDLPACTVQWQGTSSLQYAVKNYKIKLKDEEGKKFKRPLRGKGIPESTFCLKADYMESSHANNTGLAKIVNRYLYESKLPPQELNPDVVSAIDGFPMKLYINDELIGIFNFNLDKGCEDSFGLDTDLFPECISYEVVANTDSTAGAFNKWTSSQGGTELEYLQRDFELRYPDSKKVGDDYGYLTKLKRVVDWVSDADDETFRREFEQYFNKEYTLKYYLMVVTLGMVDNLGKNMMLNTWDGEIWYPCFYDLDTALALDNTGYLKFDVDIEVEGGTFNTSASKLWSKLARVFDAELKQLYIKMRSTIFKEANIFKVLIEEQVDSIPELLYNLDSQQKYLNFGKTYLHMLHGNRREHMIKWVNERLLYIDSKWGYEEHTKESITVRANKQGNVYFDIKTYSPIYIKVRWRNGEEQVQKIGRGKTVRYSYSLPTATDQEIFIYGAKHLKEIGDISHMTPSSLSLGNAIKLTKLICRNSANLQAIGIGGEGYNLKNLQEINLSGCTKLGSVAGNNSLDVSYCTNLKKLNVWDTALQSITFNVKGGNLEEFYPSYSLTNIRLVNQYNLHTFKFLQGTAYYDRGGFRSISEGSKASQLIIRNCPFLTDVRCNHYRDLDEGLLYTYLNTSLRDLPDYSIFTKDEYKKMFHFAHSFPNLEVLEIDNSLLDYTLIGNALCRNLKTVTFKNMPNLRGYHNSGNREFGGTGGNVNSNIEGTPMFEGISISKCPAFDTLFLCRGNNGAYAFKFKEDFVLDLTHLPLKNVYIQVNLENLKGLILPETVENFVFPYSWLSPHDQYASDKSRCKYTADMSPLEFLTIGSREEGFVGVDMKNHPMKDFNFNGHPKFLPVYKNINSSPRYSLPSIFRGELADMNNGNYTPPTMSNIRFNLNNYQHTSLDNFLRGVDGSAVKVTLDKELHGLSCQYTCVQTKNTSGTNLHTFMSKLKGCKAFKTFIRSDFERLDLQGFIGTDTTDMNNCFANMPNVTEISVKGSDFSNVTTFASCFQASSNLQKIYLSLNTSYEKAVNLNSMFRDLTNLELLEVTKLITPYTTNMGCMFLNTHNLQLNFNELIEGWEERRNVQTDLMFMNHAKNLVFEGVNDYVLDLSTIPINHTGSVGGHGEHTLNGCGFTKIVYDNHNLTTVSGFGWDTLFGVSNCPNLQELIITNTPIPRHVAFPQNCPKLTKVDLTGSDFSATNSSSGTFFNNCPNLSSVKFGYNYPVPLTISTATQIEADSLVSILNGLKDLTDATTQKITLGTKNLEKLSPEQIRIATDKNWTVA